MGHCSTAISKRKPPLNNFAIQVIQGQFLLYDHSISSHLVAKPNSQESKPFKQIKQWKIQVILLDMHAYKWQITQCPLHMHIIDSHIVLISTPSLFASAPRLSWGFSTLFFTVVALAFLLSVQPHNAARFLEGEKKEYLIENHQPCARFLNLPFSEILPCGACCGYSTDCACSPFSQKNHQPVFSLFFLKKNLDGILYGWTVHLISQKSAACALEERSPNGAWWRLLKWMDSGPSNGECVL